MVMEGKLLLPAGALEARVRYSLQDDGRVLDLTSQRTGSSYKLAIAQAHARLYVGSLSLSAANGVNLQAGRDFVDMGSYDLVHLPANGEDELSARIAELRLGQVVDVAGYIQYRSLTRQARPQLVFRPMIIERVDAGDEDIP